VRPDEKCSTAISPKAAAPAAAMRSASPVKRRNRSVETWSAGVACSSGFSIHRRGA
jgi:hypothetical protein